MAKDYLVLNSITFQTTPNLVPWWITNLTPEMDSGFKVKGGNIPIPHTNGSMAFKRRKAETVKQFKVCFSGLWHTDGSASVLSWAQQIQTNVRYLRTNIGLGYSSGDGTVTAVYHLWSGTTESASVQVTDFTVSDVDHKNVTAVLELTIPGGVFA